MGGIQEQDGVWGMVRVGRSSRQKSTHTPKHTAARGWEQGAGQVAMGEQVAKRMPTQVAQSWLEELVYQEGTETVRAGGGQ